MKKFFTFFTMFLFLNISGCNINPPNNVPIEDTTTRAIQNIPNKIALLSEINLTTVDTIEKYKVFADSINNLIVILNEQNDLFSIPQIPATQNAWNKASKTITEYGPLINNYNEVIHSARTYDISHNDENLREFYSSSGKFAFETAIIVGTVFYTASFEAVGIVYKAVGLNRLALSCGTCVSVILSHAHWTIRTVLVEGSSQFAQKILDNFQK